MKKRILSYILSFCMIAGVAGMLPVSVSAEIDSGSCGDNVIYTLNTETGKLTISGIGDMQTSPWQRFYNYIRTVEIEEGVTGISRQAFYNCKNLTSVTLPKSLINIGEYAFCYCRNLKNIIIPDNVTNIGEGAFYDCESLTSIKIPDCVTVISNLLCWNCINLTSVTLSDNVTVIGNAAFMHCSIENIKISEKVTTIEEGAFGGCSRLTSVTIPESVTNIAGNAFSECNSLKDFTVDENNDYYTFFEGALFDKGKDTIIALIYMCDSGIYEIPDGVTNIGKSAFLACTNLISVTLPDSITNIEDYAFDGCTSLTSIIIPDSVTNIGSWAFNGCNSLKSIEISNNVQTINQSTFAYCTGLKNIIIPEKVTSIEEEAFYYCSSLESVRIGINVAYIKERAFNYCNGLQDVYYDGMREEWNNVIVGSFNTGITNATIHFKDAAEVTIDGVSESYATFEAAMEAANNAGKSVDVKLLINVSEATIAPEYAHTIDINGCTVGTLNVEGDVKLTNGAVTTLNVTGIVTGENVTVTNTNAASYGSTGTKSVYTSYVLGASVIDGAQVRIGNGLVNGKIDAESGLRFIGQANMTDTLASIIVNDYYAENVYAEGYGIGIEIGAQDSDNKAYIKATKWQDESNSVFSAAVTNLAASNFNRNYTARAYVEYDGVKLYETGSTTRSMYAVAAGLLINNKAVADDLIAVLNAYVNQTGVRLTLTKDNVFSARMCGEGAYTGEAFFTVGETVYEEGMYMVTLEAIGQAKIDVDLFNTYVRINNNNSLVSTATFIMDNEDGTYTIVFDYSSL